MSAFPPSSERPCSGGCPGAWRRGMKPSSAMGRCAQQKRIRIRAFKNQVQDQRYHTASIFTVFQIDIGSLIHAQSLRHLQLGQIRLHPIFKYRPAEIFPDQSLIGLSHGTRSLRLTSTKFYLKAKGDTMRCASGICCQNAAQQAANIICTRKHQK